MVVALAVLLAGCGDGGGGDVEQALAIAEDAGRFASGAEAADALAEITDLLLEDDPCPDDDLVCQARLSAAAVAQVGAAGVLRCTGPRAFDARIAMRDLLLALRDYEADPTGDPPAAPVLPTC